MAVSVKKDAQLESRELSFTWDKMRTATWDTAPQIALRDCSKEVVGESWYVGFWWRGVQCNQARLLLSKDLFRQTSLEQSASLHPEWPQRAFNVNSCNSTGLSLHRGRWQVLLLFSHWQTLLASASLYLIEAFRVSVSRMGLRNLLSKISLVVHAKFWKHLN